MLAAVKAWAGDAGASGSTGATPSLDGVCARRHRRAAGRDEETALRSNKETDRKDHEVALATALWRARSLAASKLKQQAKGGTKIAAPSQKTHQRASYCLDPLRSSPLVHVLVTAGRSLGYGAMRARFARGLRPQGGVKFGSRLTPAPRLHAIAAWDLTVLVRRDSQAVRVCKFRGRSTRDRSP